MNVKHILFIIFFFNITVTFAQKDTLPYNPKREITYDDKRYRIYNNWISIGVGAGYSTRWVADQRNIGLDYSFHLQKNYFRLGAFMSGVQLTNQNNINFHGAYLYRKETKDYNLSASAGPSYSVFKRPLADSSRYNLGNTYKEFGVYACLEGVIKIKYDVGLGAQVFCDYNQVQMIYGVRLIAFLSSAYRGINYGTRKYVKPRD